jgi:hypothetical protein
MAFTVPRYNFSSPSAHSAYGTSDLVANSETAGDVVPLTWDVSLVNGAGQIKAVVVYTDDETVTNANFLLHIFRALPVPSVGDNGVYAVGSVDQEIGSVACDLTTGATVTASDKMKRFAITVPIGFQVGSDHKLYGLLHSQAAYDRDGVEVFGVALEIEG